MTVRPAPKPAKREKLPRQHNSTLPRPQQSKPSRSSKPMKRGARKTSGASAKKPASLARNTPVRKVNRARRKSEFARCYHSRARVLFVKCLPCIVCGIPCCDNAHIESGGTGRKADYTKIVPLCCMPMDHPMSPGYPLEHHGLFHQIGRDSFVAAYPGLRLDLDQLAADTERRWQSHLNGESK